MDLRFLQRIERGETNISVESLVAISDSLGAEPEVLFEEAKLSPPVKGRPRRAKAE